MSRLARLRLDVTLDEHAWRRPSVCRITPDGWLDWTASEPVWIDGTGGILDRFVEIGREPQPGGEWSRPRAVKEFVVRFGPWGYCDGGQHRHMPFRPRGYADESGIERPRLEKGADGRSHINISTQDLLAELVLASQRVGALRRITARLWDIYVPSRAPSPAADWTMLGYPMPVDDRGDRDPRAEAAYAADIVNGWLRTTHVLPLAGFMERGGPDQPDEPDLGTGPGLVVGTAVGGAAGGLALAMLRELTQRPKLAVCPKCHTTHLQQSNRSTPKCDACRQLGTKKKEHER
jgi:hypothetical protein